LTRLFPPRPAEVAEVHVRQGQEVGAGDPIVTLRSPELVHRITLASRRLALVELRLARRGTDDQDRTASLSLERERAALRSQLAGLEAERAELVVRTPIAGDVAELNLEVQPGRTIGRAEPIALIRGGDTLIARGYLAEHDLARLDGTGGTTGGMKNDGGWFAPDDPQLARRQLKLASVASASSATIEIAELASQHGGPLAVRPKAEAHGPRQLVPLAASYLTVFDVTDGAAPLHKSERGVIHLDGRPESLLARMWRQTLKVLVRESGI
ncbi:MAG: biotin/lipoyl-binding protein, partial [Hyphomicrobium sp.]